MKDTFDLLNLSRDTDKFENGVWIPLSSATKIKVAGWGSKRWEKAVKDLEAADQKLKDNWEKATIEEKADFFVKVTARAILLGWENLPLDGELIEYSEENAYKVLSDPTLIPFQNLVLKFAKDMGTFRVESKKKAVEALKNV